ncbi:hypothetical protein [uncultured Aureimonas sp.]|uniref:hypothetical protein n=1 Tax=uncultured Aureimonas sp. TaxID=1604662 RepID=UPI0025F1D67B|nr:hypothetical protein [uncultured Aureimonas sp.]
MADGMVEVAEAEDDRDPLESWRQGDYTLGVRDFPTIVLAADGSPDLLFREVVGVAVVTQTCDIVNAGEGKDSVIAAPLVQASEKLLKEAAAGRSPVCAVLDNPPTPDVVVDLGRMMAVEKAVVRTWERLEGFGTDEGRAGFGSALERKHGRFAYPDPFVRAISKWRSRILSKHDKDSETGRVYRSVRMLRVAAYPHWEAEAVRVLLYVVLEDGDLPANDKEMGAELKAQLDAIVLPERYSWAEGRFRIGTLDQLTARDLHESQVLDVNFLSGI